MDPSSSDTFTVADDEAGLTLAAWLRRRLSGQSWSTIRQHIASRRVRINGELCLDPARRLRGGEVIEFLSQSAPKPRQPEMIVIRHLDEHVVVAEKPAGLNTVRHPAERRLSLTRQALSPTLEDLLPPLIAERDGRQAKGPLPRLRVVHRIDKETSGLVVFARTVQAERGLGRQFHRHTIWRRYLAVVVGIPASGRIESRLVRDRGDGRRGSTSIPGLGKEAVTHVEVLERPGPYTLVACRLETGRTHQIRIHLAEQGHRICGEKVYNRPLGGPPLPDTSGAPRLALHAAELGFVHPSTGAAMHWSTPLPADLQTFIARLRQHKEK
ncbi:MAG TPA: RluA family pseudouridine synthase [Gemmataceae bacterium]|nr:RluA family pseudouridine synthase [Gemmataceae bacterium]